MQTAKLPAYSAFQTRDPMSHEPTNASDKGRDARHGGLPARGEVGARDDARLGRGDPLTESDSDHEHEAGEAGEASRLAIDLSGSMPCVSCQYDLRGLSITATCPECGTPVRATLVRVIDPEGQTTAPLRSPQLASWAIVWWAGTSALAALGMLVLHLLHDVVGGSPRVRDAIAMATLSVAYASSVGPLSLIFLFKGRERTPRQGLALLAWVLTMMLCMMLMDPVLTRTNWGYTRGPWVERRAILGILVVAILLSMRPTVRLLAARGWVQQQAHKDRQTTISLALVVGIGTLAIFGVAASPIGSDPILARFLSQMIVILTLMLLTLGLGRLAVELLRMRRRIAAGLVAAGRVVPRPSASGAGKG